MDAVTAPGAAAGAGDRVRRGIEGGLGAVSALALGFAAAYVGIAVVGLMLRTNPPDEDLLVAEALVVLAFAPQYLLARRDRHVSVGLFVDRLPHAMQRAADGFAALCGMATYLLLGLAGWSALERALANGSVYVSDLDLAEWPGRAMVVLGTAGGLVAAALRLADAMRGGR